MRLNISAGLLYFNAAVRPPGTDFHGVLHVMPMDRSAAPRAINNSMDIWGDFALDGDGFYYFTLSPAPTYAIQLRKYFWNGTDHLVVNNLPIAPGTMTLVDNILYWTTGSGGANSSYVMQTSVPGGLTEVYAKIPCDPKDNCWAGSVVAVPPVPPAFRCCLYQYGGSGVALVQEMSLVAQPMVSPFCVPTKTCPTITPVSSFETSM